MKVHTQSVHFDADAKLLEFINKKLAKLEQFFDKIIETKVLLKLENSGQVRDKVTEIKLSIPGSVLFVKETNKTFEAAIDKAIDTLKRQLIRYKERLRTN